MERKSIVRRNTRVLQNCCEFQLHVSTDNNVSGYSFHLSFLLVSLFLPSSGTRRKNRLASSSFPFTRTCKNVNVERIQKRLAAFLPTECTRSVLFLKARRAYKVSEWKLMIELQSRFTRDSSQIAIIVSGSFSFFLSGINCSMGIKADVYPSTRGFNVINR